MLAQSEHFDLSDAATRAFVYAGRRLLVYRAVLLPPLTCFPKATKPSKALRTNPVRAHNSLAHRTAQTLPSDNDRGTSKQTLAHRNVLPRNGMARLHQVWQLSEDMALQQHGSFFTSSHPGPLAQLSTASQRSLVKKALWPRREMLSLLVLALTMTVSGAKLVASGQADYVCRRGVAPARSISPRSPAKQIGQVGGVLLVVPGVGDAMRARLVARNIEVAEPRACIIFTHLRCGEDQLLDELFDARADSLLSSMCEVVRATNGIGGGYVAHLKRVLPGLVDMGGFEWVFVLLDDVALPRQAFSLPRMLKLARRNNLTAVSPAVRFAHDDVMQPAPAGTLPEGAVGRVVHRLEIFAVALTQEAFRCWYELIDTALNSVGWGYDHWLFIFCREWPRLMYKAGIIDTMVVVHGGQTRAAANSSVAANARTYVSKEAKDAKELMRTDFRRRGLPYLHPVDRNTHGWLYSGPRYAALQSLMRTHCFAAVYFKRLLQAFCREHRLCRCVNLSGRAACRHEGVQSFADFFMFSCIAAS
eukprot:6197399-Pleurochrysis_carterae.AAC.3